jgi:hypothetical protein
MFTINQIAEMCHEVNRSYSRLLGDYSHDCWEDSPEWQRESATKGVVKALEGLGPRELHIEWLKHKEQTGWKHGKIKDEKALTHPCMVPYDELPEEQRIKDELFASVVRIMSRGVKIKE